MTLYAVDGVVWRTPETPDKEKAFVRSGTEAGASTGCQNENEMVLAKGLIERACDKSLTLFDKGYTSFGLLSAWHEAGENRHWMIAARKDLQYEEVRRLGKGDILIRVKTSAQSRKKWPHLAAHTEMRMISREIKGRTWRFLTSMTDAMRYPGKEIADLYSHRWEIELGYLEIKQGLQDSWLTLRSWKPEMVRLPGRRERSFPRVVKERPYKYPTARRKNASQA